MNFISMFIQSIYTLFPRVSHTNVFRHIKTQINLKCNTKANIKLFSVCSSFAVENHLTTSVTENTFHSTSGN